jgi:hypothetical protein
MSTLINFLYLIKIVFYLIFRRWIYFRKEVVHSSHFSMYEYVCDLFRRCHQRFPMYEYVRDLAISKALAEFII